MAAGGPKGPPYVQNRGPALQGRHIVGRPFRAGMLI